MSCSRNIFLLPLTNSRLINSCRLLTILRKQTMQASTNNTANHVPVVTAGIVIIGNELVKGQIQDSNSFYMCQKLHQRGVQVKTIITIPDDFAMITQYVTDFSEKFTFVITTGGIGPTHDDITFEAIAKAFGGKAKVDLQLESLYKEYFKDKYTDSHRKLATIPEMASLFQGEGRFPVVHLKNIFILPGVPRFLKLAFQAVEDYICKTTVAPTVKTLYLTIDEMSIASDLTRVDLQFPEVTIGSYPVWDNNYYKVRIVLESVKPDAVEQCMAELCKHLPADTLIDYNEDFLNMPAPALDKVKVGALENPLTEALSVCNEALQRYKLEEICIGFNGGKDCTALLHIWYTVASQHPDYKTSPGLQAIYIRNTDPFHEEELFIERCVDRYKLRMMKYTGKIREQLAQMKLQHPNIKAVVMGTRFTDPHGEHLNDFQPTDKGWPELMRINPILGFSYSNVWALLRGLNLPYCKLYDAGYTSLGCSQTTHLNSALRYTDSNGEVRYKPAYTLTDHQLERSGRHS